MPAPNLGGDSKDEAVGEETLLSLSQGESFTVSDLETLATLQAELDRLQQDGSDAHIEIVEEVKGEVGEEIVIEEETEVVEETVITEETEFAEEVGETETEIITGLPLHEEEVESTSDNIVEVITSEDIEGAEVLIEESQNDKPENTLAEVKSAETLIATQAAGAGKNAFNFPGQIMKVTVSGGQIVSQQMIGQYSPKMQVANSNSSVTKTVSAGSNVVHLKTVKKAAVQPKPVSFQTIQNYRTFSKPVAVKRAASSSVDQSRNQSAKVIINSDLSAQPVILAAEPSVNKTVAVTTPSQNIKVITGVSLPQSTVASPTKSITLVQAKQVGLLGSGKLQQIIPSSPQKSIVVNKIGPLSPKKVTLMKSPSKILPAPGPQAKGSKISMQKIFLRQGNSLKPATFLSPGQQVIRLQSPQNIVPSAAVSNLGTLHQIQLPGSNKVQLVRVVGAGSNTATVVPNSSVNQATVVSVTTALSTASTSEVKTFPVTILPAPATSVSASISNSSPSNIITINTSASNGNIVSSSAGSSSKVPLRPKIVSIAPAKPTNTGGLLYSVPSQSGSVPVSSAKAVNVVMLPSQYIQQVQQDMKSSFSPLTMSSKLEPAEIAKEATKEVKMEVKMDPEFEMKSSKAKLGPIPSSQITTNGIRPRKPCNCTRSQCLKLYCDCFASGEFCYMCNCNSCFNNLEHEEDRQLAIKSCLERNPNAFRPKIGRTYATDTERRHTKGCNCKRSGCLKNYCECYEAKIPCSHNCKCVGCRNIEDGTLAIRRHREELREEMAAQSLTTLATIADDLSSNMYQAQSSKISTNMFSTDVLEATVQCLLAQAFEAQEKGLDKVKSQQLLLEEYGRCLKSIIDFSSSNQDLT